MTAPPNNVLTLVQLLQDGPLAIEAARSKLAAAGVRMTVELLVKLPDRYPSLIGVDKRGRLTLPALAAQSRVRKADVDVAPRWWAQRPAVTPFDLGRVWVIDIETTGLDPNENEVWQIAAVRLSDQETHLWEVECDGRPMVEGGRTPIALADALVALDGVMSGADAVAGHRVGQFDVPFLEKAAARAGVVWKTDLPVLDLYDLSLLVDPCAPSRSLTDLSDQFGVTLTRAHQADHDATATAQVMLRMLDRVDADDESWRLAVACLAKGGHPLAALLPPVPDPSADLAEVLQPVPDPLSRPGDGDRYPSAMAALRAQFEVLKASREGYVERTSQREMAQAVAETLDGNGRLAVEAPTGTGKSLAYLLPAAARAGHARRPVVVATHTKVLQRQLRADAERLRAVGLLPAPFRQIQGVSNYLCTRNISEAVEAAEAEGTEWLALAVAIRSLTTAPNGVWDDVTDGLALRTDLAFARRRRSLVATSSTCDRSRCEHVTRCPLYERLSGLDARPGILAVNHALIASWVQVERDGGRAPGDILGEDPASLVFDEAHNLEDSLTAAWTESTGAVDLAVLVASAWGRFGPVRWAHDIARRSSWAHDALEEMDGLRSQIDAALDRLGAAVEVYLHEYGGREGRTVLQWGVSRGRPEFRSLAAASALARGSLRGLRGALLSIAISLDQALEAGSIDASFSKGVTGLRARIDGVVADLESRIEVLEGLEDLAEPHRFVHMLGVEGETSEEGEAPATRWTFERLPIEVADRFRTEVVAKAQSVVLTSATLAVGDSFDFLARRLGIRIGDEPDAFQTRLLASPFDYDAQSAVVLTSHLSLPVPGAEREFVEDLAADQVGFLSLSGGRALTLFAARRRMEAVAELVRTKEEELSERDVEILVQGEDSFNRHTNRFRERLGSVLYGLRTFWEGFDAPGETLSYLFIEKPPWPHPGDAIEAARQRLITDAGGDPFLDYAAPRTAIALAQGFGRLIRSESDRGVAIICDRRMQIPTTANQMLIDTLPTSTICEADSRDEAWRFAIGFVTGTEPDLTTALVLSVNLLAATLEELRLLPGEDPLVKLQLAAQQIFGIEQLRPEQIELMLAILGGGDALGFLPTGFGKSLCFQLPALLHPENRATVVVSPLIALIKDQVDELRARRGLRMVRGITGRTSAAERDDTLRDVAEGLVRLLYVSPERLVRDRTLSAALQQQQLNALVVDEAHCVSSWGHDFRPEFRQVVKPVLAFERSPRVGLTATATREVEQDLDRTLVLDDATVVRAPVDRPDLRYWVRECDGERTRTQELLRFIAYQGDKPGIVYASRRALTEELAWIIRQSGVTARSYHAGMVPEQRDATQDDFLAGSTQVVVATKAFGMGINKPDIGWVVHYDLPESVEAYAQESGRAARSADLNGDCLLLFTRRDLARRRRQAGKTDSGNVAVAERLVAYIARQPTRGGDHLVDPEELATDLELEPDRTAVLVAWLEQIGTLTRHQDASLRGAITLGRREPSDLGVRTEFFRILRAGLHCRIGTRRLIELDKVAQDLGLSADDLENRLIDWSLQRLLSFNGTRRAWRIEIHGPVDAKALADVIAAWRRLEKRRIDHMAAFATGHTCRRTAIGTAFGDAVAPCGDSADLRCDACAGAAPFWHAIPVNRVPDPEELVDVELVVLQAVRWSTWSRDGAPRERRFSERNLVSALCGDEGSDERPLAAALFRCPQFGATKYLRNPRKRVETTVASLVARGDLGRAETKFRESTYRSLELTDAGRRKLGVAVG
ncbi:MAG: RecQ family ATP-dependent DNA helicase [Actinomycetota bacterium]